MIDRIKCLCKIKKDSTELIYYYDNNKIRNIFYDLTVCIHMHVIWLTLRFAAMLLTGVDVITTLFTY